MTTVHSILSIFLPSFFPFFFVDPLFLYIYTCTHTHIQRHLWRWIRDIQEGQEGQDTIVLRRMLREQQTGIAERDEQLARANTTLSQLAEELAHEKVQRVQAENAVSDLAREAAEANADHRPGGAFGCR